MITLNIEALRKTQESIADTTLSFNMFRWGTCICAHAARANAWINDPFLISEQLGVSELLFLPGAVGPTDRSAAIARIQALIDAAAPPATPEPEPVPVPDLELVMA